MKLLYIHESPIPSASANSVQVAKMCDAFVRAGAHVILVAPPSQRSGYPEIARLYGLRGPAFLVFPTRRPPMPGKGLVYGLYAFLRHGRGGLVYTRSISVAFAAHALGAAVVLELHEAESWRPGVADRLGRLTKSRRLLRVVAISNRLAEALAARWPVLASRLMVAPDGADPIEHQPEPAILSETRPGCANVGYVGQLYPGKGVETIAETARLFSDAVFHIVGGLDPLVTQWKSRSPHSSNLVFYGQRSHGEVKGFIEAFDIVLAPYLAEVRGVDGSNLVDWMSPLKIFEYMAQAKPIISSDLPAIREILTNERNALLCPPGDAAALSSAISRLAGDAQLRRRLGENARADFLSRYSWDQRAQSILAGLAR